METFMIASVKHQAATETSFSNIGGALQRQEGRLDNIDQTTGTIKERLAVTENDIHSLKGEKERQWGVINAHLTGQPVDPQTLEDALDPNISQLSLNRKGLKVSGPAAAWMARALGIAILLVILAEVGGIKIVRPAAKAVLSVFTDEVAP
jgi:hypothetical protein